MKIERLKVGFMRCNCYILDIDNKLLVIDPGEEYQKIINTIGDREVLAILITHRHFDHIGAVNELYKKYKCPIYDYANIEETSYTIEKYKFKVIRTKGHSNDSITYYFYNDKIMFTGDFLFKDTIGRCDLPESNINEMNKSIEKIKKYNDNIKIYPGHGIDTVLGYEKENNIYFIKGLQDEDY